MGHIRTYYGVLPNFLERLHEIAFIVRDVPGVSSGSHSALTPVLGPGVEWKSFRTHQLSGSRSAGFGPRTLAHHLTH